MCSPSQVLGDVYTEVLEAAYSLHRGPADHKRSVGQQVSLSEVHNQLFSFAHIQRETVVLTPWCKFLYLIQVCGLIVGNEAQNHSVINKFDNRCGAVGRHAVVCVDFEVQVKGKTGWELEVVRESINRKGELTVSPSEAYWIVILRNDDEYAAYDDPSVSLSLRVQPQRVGVFVDYEEGLVSFYDVESSSHIYSFTDKLYPYLRPELNDEGENSAPLIITPEYYIRQNKTTQWRESSHHYLYSALYNIDIEQYCKAASQ